MGENVPWNKLSHVGGKILSLLKYRINSPIVKKIPHSKEDEINPMIFPHTSQIFFLMIFHNNFLLLFQLNLHITLKLCLIVIDSINNCTKI